MAIKVGYFENTTDCYTEGPFVMVNASGWRIECGSPQMKCPTLPDVSIYAFLRDRGLPDAKTDDADLCACCVDYLNAKVKDGTLVVNAHGYPIWELYGPELEARLLQAARLRLKRMQESIEH